jgi:hypothetical protein
MPALEEILRRNGVRHLRPLSPCTDLFKRLHQNPLKELYSKPRHSTAWEEQQAEIVRFWTDDGDSWGFLFHRLGAVHYNARNERLLIDWDLGTLVIAKALDFYDDFCSHRATSLKADGKDMLSVRMLLNSGEDTETV